MAIKDYPTMRAFTSALVDDMIGAFPEDSPKSAWASRRIKDAYCKYFTESGLSQYRLRSAFDNCVNFMGLQRAPSASYIIDLAREEEQREINARLLKDAEQEEERLHQRTPLSADARAEWEAKVNGGTR